MTRTGQWQLFFAIFGAAISASGILAIFLVKETRRPTVAIGTYSAVLHALGGMDKDLGLVVKDDELGRKLQDLNLPARQRAKRCKPTNRTNTRLTDE
jgi:hypothetical protein